MSVTHEILAAASNGVAVLPTLRFFRFTVEQYHKMGRLEVYSDPSGPADEPDYHRRRDYAAEEQLPVVLDDRDIGGIAVRDILP